MTNYDTFSLMMSDQTHYMEHLMTITDVMYKTQHNFLGFIMKLMQIADMQPCMLKLPWISTNDINSDASQNHH